MKKQSKVFIYVYKTAAGVWADFDYNKAVGHIVETIDATDPYKVMEDPGRAMPGRVKALAERLILDRPPPRPEIVEVQVPAKLPDTLWGRLKFVVTGEL
ncbi:MAG: hypothetical protein A3E01_07100 [Gammaproteobacteria bacterium RIFCSPHIGHO2_12_FULL_63_22]|nr:MAG: hypothetical protein A3E01_07100 [Gammaproteobacteria bacterium RIFCSPHIGHO2_12_FULL_63_22]